MPNLNDLQIFQINLFFQVKIIFFQVKIILMKVKIIICLNLNLMFSIHFIIYFMITWQIYYSH